MPCSYVVTTAVSIRHSVSRRAAQQSQIFSKSPTYITRGLSSSKVWLFLKWNLVASWMHLHNCRCFQKHVRMLLQGLRALCLAPGGSGSIKKYFEGTLEVSRSVWEHCGWNLNWLTFCKYKFIPMYQFTNTDGMWQQIYHVQDVDQMLLFQLKNVIAKVFDAHLDCILR